jgi:putative peptidoglycan lipid II flippase
MQTSQAVNVAAPPSTTRLLRSVLVVMAGFLLTKGVSLAQTFIIAGRFGAGADYDTFAAGSIAPDYLVRLIGGGALGVAFIPVFSGLLNQNQQEAAWKLANQVLNSLFMVALCLSIGVMIFAEPLIEEVIASGFSPAQVTQTAQLMRILSLAAVIFCVSGIISGILHGHNNFFLPVLAPIFQDLGLLFGVIFFLPPFGIYGLAWGTLLGAILHLGIQIPGLVRLRYHWQGLLGWRDPQLRHVFTLMLPRILIGITFVIDLVVITNINSRLGEGAISAFSWSNRFIDIPQALLGTAVGIVLFPTLSALTATQQVEKRRRAFVGAMRFMLVATIPASVGLILVSYDALRVLFDEADSRIIFASIQILGVAIIVQSLHELLTRAFYAQQDTLRPLLFAIIASLVSVAVMWLGFNYYRDQARIVAIETQWPWPLVSPVYDPPLASFWAVGIPALGYVLTFLVEVVLLAWLLRQRWGDIGLGELWQVGRTTLLATLGMVIAIVLTRQAVMIAGFDAFTLGHILIRLAAEVGIGLLTFGLAAWALHIPEIRMIWPRLKQVYYGEDAHGAA